MISGHFYFPLTLVIAFFQVIDQIKGGYFSQGNPNEFKDVVDNLMYHDRFLTLADYDSYIKAQDKVSATYKVRLSGQSLSEYPMAPSRGRAILNHLQGMR